MSFQGYLDTIQSKTGISTEELLEVAASKGFDADAKPADVIAWADADYGLGRGHAMAIVKLLRDTQGPKLSAADKVDAVFSGPRVHWRPVFEALVDRLRSQGLVITLQSTESYVSLLKGKGKIGIVAPVTDRLDIGIKLKDMEPTARFEEAGAWNTMVTHRVRISDPAEVDEEVIDWLKAAYAAAP
jgi:hypothetical protein